MLNSERQAHIKATLSTAAEPLSASSFARRFTVSRQTIVGDIALLRAQGEPIIATPRGYTLSHPADHEFLIPCKHTPEQTVQELQLILDNGGWIEDVLVEHPLYGQLRGQLNIRTVADMKLFLSRLARYQGRHLSELTGGIHLHTISVRNERNIAKIKEALRKAGILYEQSEVD